MNWREVKRQQDVGVEDTYRDTDFRALKEQTVVRSLRAKSVIELESKQLTRFQIS